jgi:hypothetical protein
MDDLHREGLLSNDVMEKLGEFDQKNYLDPKLETKFMKARAGVYSYARWKRSVDPHYVFDWEMFKKVARYRKLNVPASWQGVERVRRVRLAQRNQPADTSLGDPGIAEGSEGAGRPRLVKALRPA